VCNTSAYDGQHINCDKENMTRAHFYQFNALPCLDNLGDFLQDPGLYLLLHGTRSEISVSHLDQKRDYHVHPPLVLFPTQWGSKKQQNYKYFYIIQKNRYV